MIEQANELYRRGATVPRPDGFRIRDNDGEIVHEFLEAADARKKGSAWQAEIEGVGALSQIASPRRTRSRRSDLDEQAGARALLR